MRGPEEVIKDPQLRPNEIVVPLEGAGGKLTSTISSPLQVHGVAKAPARRAPDLGEHNDEILKQLGFSANEIEGLHASGTVPKASSAPRNVLQTRWTVDEIVTERSDGILRVELNRPSRRTR